MFLKCFDCLMIMCDAFMKHVLLCISVRRLKCMLSVLFSVYLFICHGHNYSSQGSQKNINKMLIVTFFKLAPEGKKDLSIKYYKLAKGQNKTRMDIKLNIYCICIHMANAIFSFFLSLIMFTLPFNWKVVA